jgi:hypothetical protein
MKVHEPSTKVFFSFEKVEICGGKVLQKIEKRTITID